MCDSDLVRELKNNPNDDEKLENLSKIMLRDLRLEVVKTMVDDNKIVESFKYLENNYYVIDALKLIKSDQVLINFYDRCPEELRYYVVKNMHYDYNKLKYINNLDERDQEKIVLSFKDEEIIKEYVLLNKYDSLEEELIKKIHDTKVLSDCFKKLENTKLKLLVLEQINDENVKKDLIETIDSKMYYEILRSNTDDGKKEALENIKLDGIKYDIDPDITIGLEFECCHIDKENILLIKNMMKTWNIKKEPSVRAGLEITSPVLNYNNESLKELYYVCDFMKKNGFYTDKSCGGHIHLGFDYFKSIEQLDVFLKLYISVEKLLYIIGNKEGSKSRVGVTKFAKFSSGVLSQVTIDKFDKPFLLSFDQYAEEIKNIQYGEKNYGLNTNHIENYNNNTLEFRFPNGEIDFNEVAKNIRLLCKLLESSKKIVILKDEKATYLYRKLLSTKLNNESINDNLYQRMVNESVNQKEKLEILMNLLFDDEEEKQVYDKRYESNKYKLKVKHMGQYREVRK